MGGTSSPGHDRGAFPPKEFLPFKKGGTSLPITLNTAPAELHITTAKHKARVSTMRLGAPGTSATSIGGRRWWRGCRSSLSAVAFSAVALAAVAVGSRSREGQEEQEELLRRNGARRGGGGREERAGGVFRAGLTSTFPCPRSLAAIPNQALAGDRGHRTPIRGKLLVSIVRGLWVSSRHRDNDRASGSS